MIAFTPPFSDISRSKKKVFLFIKRGAADQTDAKNGRSLSFGNCVHMCFVESYMFNSLGYLF